MSLKPVLLVTALALGACGAEDDRPPSLSYLQHTVIKQSCATATCHVSANETSTYPAFDTDHVTLRETLLSYVNCDATTCFAYADPAMGVTTNSPLIDFLEGNGEAEKMPPDEPIPDADIALIAAWIDAGAEDN